MRESEIEKHGREQLERRGCLYPKIRYTGWPDRLVIFPSGKLVWIEYKKPEGTPRKLQRLVIKHLRHRNQDVRVIDSKTKVDILIREAEMKGWYSGKTIRAL